MSEALVVVGDVHGDLQRLHGLLREIRPLRRRVVFLGDYVDRGINSAGVLHALVKEKARLGDRLVLLAGNHELAFLRYLDSGDLIPFASMGGMATIRSYVGVAFADVHAQLREAIPVEHERLVRDELKTCYETEDVLLSHMGFDPDQPLLRTRETLVEMPHPSLFDDGVSLPSKLAVCGHYVQRTGRPFERDGFIALDTGCGVGGPLTAIMLPEHKFLTA